MREEKTGKVAWWAAQQGSMPSDRIEEEEYRKKNPE
jgi:hypothetical protein